jgi:hypothetical protein
MCLLRTYLKSILGSVRFLTFIVQLLYFSPAKFNIIAYFFKLDKPTPMTIVSYYNKFTLFTRSVSLSAGLYIFMCASKISQPYNCVLIVNIEYSCRTDFALCLFINSLRKYTV